MNDILVEGYYVRLRRDKLIRDVKETIIKIIENFTIDKVVYDIVEYELAKESFFNWLSVKGVILLRDIDYIVVNRLRLDELEYRYEALLDEMDFRYPKDLLIRLDDLADVLNVGITMK